MTKFSLHRVLVRYLVMLMGALLAFMVCTLVMFGHGVGASGDELLSMFLEGKPVAQAAVISLAVTLGILLAELAHHGRAGASRKPVVLGAVVSVVAIAVLGLAFPRAVWIREQKNLIAYAEYEGFRQLELENYERSIEIFVEAITRAQTLMESLIPDGERMQVGLISIKAERNLGVAYLRSGMREQAISHLRAAIVLEETLSRDPRYEEIRSEVDELGIGELLESLREDASVGEDANGAPDIPRDDAVGGIGGDTCTSAMTCAVMWSTCSGVFVCAEGAAKPCNYGVCVDLPPAIP